MRQNYLIGVLFLNLTSLPPSLSFCCDAVLYRELTIQEYGTLIRHTQRKGLNPAAMYQYSMQMVLRPPGFPDMVVYYVKGQGHDGKLELDPTTYKECINNETAAKEGGRQKVRVQPES